jgi:hypothetical protein
MGKKQHGLRPHEQRAIETGQGGGMQAAPPDQSAAAPPRQPKQQQGKRGNGKR